MILQSSQISCSDFPSLRFLIHFIVGVINGDVLWWLMEKTRSWRGFCANNKQFKQIIINEQIITIKYKYFLLSPGMWK